MSVYIGLVESVDVIHAHNPPDTLAVVGRFHKLFGRKYVYDQHDLSPELYQSRFGLKHGLLVRVLVFVEGLCWRWSDLTIATNQSYKDIAVRRGGLNADKVAIVRNGPDLGRVRVVPPDAQLRESGKLILVYVGAMNPQDGVDYLLRSLRYLLVDLGRKDFYCVLIGPGDSVEELKVLATEFGLSKTFWK